MARIQDNQNAAVIVECLATTSVPSYQIIAKQGEIRHVTADVARYLVSTGKFIIKPAPVVVEEKTAPDEEVAVVEETATVEEEEAPVTPKRRRKE